MTRRIKWMARRRAGALMPVFSLPGAYGIGTLGRSAYEFIDFICEAGLSYWQVLPLGPAGKGYSPYSSPSSFAGNPLFIDWELAGQRFGGDIVPAKPASLPGRIDYASLSRQSDCVLRRAFARMDNDAAASVRHFAESRAWLADYALYEAIRADDTRQWHEWPEPLKRRDPSALSLARDRLRSQIDYHAFAQWLFFEQWSAVKAYANERGVAIVGDTPIYAALNSADVWADPGQFQLDDDLSPTEISGCPPDFFNADGQLWENPLYRWDVMERDGYDWWTRRLGAAAEMFDVTRIDHFRGFEAYYAIPSGASTARGGRWRPGPGYPFFERIKKALSDPEVIAEDLGDITPGVRKLLKRTGYPGMKVLQFAFDPDADSDYLPHKYERNCAVYTGTHDNDTSKGWYDGISAKERRFFRLYTNMGRLASPSWSMIRAAWSSAANTAIAPMQDFLELGGDCRVNVPGVADGNWGWRVREGLLTYGLAKKIRAITELYGR
ncbi:MAG: 4-alpha-glucanotransferase [Oscillospiraceae bacterium]|nr:4-alpha-glucanotransferase [Oscillospiraceae bacterium]